MEDHHYRPARVFYSLEGDAGNVPADTDCADFERIQDLVPSIEVASCPCLTVIPANLLDGYLIEEAVGVCQPYDL